MAQRRSPPTQVQCSKSLQRTRETIGTLSAMIEDDWRALDDRSLNERARYVKLDGIAGQSGMLAMNMAHLLGLGEVGVKEVVAAFVRAAEAEVRAMEAHSLVGWVDMQPRMRAFEMPWLGRWPECILRFEFPSHPIPATKDVGMETVYPKYWIARIQNDQRVLREIVDVMATRTRREDEGSALSRTRPDPKVVASILCAALDRNVDRARMGLTRLLAWHDRLAKPVRFRPEMPLETMNQRLICLEACAIAAAAWSDGLDLGDLGPYVPRALICDPID